jgi:serine/threonine protein kinase
MLYTATRGEIWAFLLDSRQLIVLHSTHQDIKESNVLYMYNDGSLDNRKRVCFKLADFGKSHFKIAGGTIDEGRDVNNVGNRIYSESLAANDSIGKPEANILPCGGAGVLRGR